MHSKRQQIPMKVSTWMDQDVRIRKFTSNLGNMSKDARQNVFLSRQFYSNMYNLSSERYRKMAQCDLDKKTFLVNQRTKAEKFLPGLLPYVEPLCNGVVDDKPSTRSSKKTDSDNLSRFQSFITRSPTKYDLKNISVEQTVPKNKMPQIIQNKKSNGLQISPKQKNRTNQIQSNLRPVSIQKPRVHSKYQEPFTVDDIFSNIDDESSFFSITVEDKPKSAAKDKRFRQLIHLFSEVHECDPSNTNTIQAIIRSKSALRNTEDKMSDSSHIKNSDIISIESSEPLSKYENYSKTDVYLIDSSS